MIGPGELLLILGVILLILLLVRGPKVLPQFGEAIGKTVKGLRDNMSDDSKQGGETDDTAADEGAEADASDSDSKPSA